MALDELAHASGPAAAAAPRWALADASMSTVSPAIDAHPPEASRSSLGSRSQHPNEDERGGLDREYLLSLRGNCLRSQHLGRTAVIGRRHADIGGEEAGEPA